MNSFRVTQLELELVARTPLALGQQAGLALRGAIFQSMRDNLNVCLYKSLPSCQPCGLRQICPLSGLLATVDDAAPRGHDAPRPMAIQPPLDDRHVYLPGQSIRFGVTLFGDGARYVPYLVLAARELERSGLGLRLEGDRNRPRRGAVELGEVVAVHLFTGERRIVRAAGENTVRPVDLAVTADDVQAHAATLPRDRLALRLLTPLRLIDRGQLVRPFRFDALIWRLLERLDALAHHYGGARLGVDRRTLVDRAADVAVEHDATHWLDLQSRSSRTGRWSPIGGLVGSVTVRGDLAPFLPWLVWGTLVHTGKSATRGNGWYRLVVPEQR